MAHEPENIVKLLFVARAVDRTAGGLERSITHIMNALLDRGHDVELLTWDRAGAEAFFAISPRILWHRLNLGDPSSRAGLGLRGRRTATIRRLVRCRRPQAIVWFQSNEFPAICLYCFGLGVPVIAAERSAPTRLDHMAVSRWERLISFSGMLLATSVVIQCESYRQLYPSFLRDRIKTIPNPVFPAPAMAKPNVPDHRERYTILSVGRLSYEKNYDGLIQAFSRIAARFAAWDLVIAGEGVERQALEIRIRRADLAGRVLMPGVVENVSEHYTGAHLFCLPSRWEGFPNALAEAQSHGLPTVGYAGCSGVNELIEHDVTGILAEGNGDVDSLATALESLMSRPQRRRDMGAAGRMSMRRFSPGAVTDLWEGVLARVAGP